jgi:hypothetical protein
MYTSYKIHMNRWSEKDYLFPCQRARNKSKKKGRATVHATYTFCHGHFQGGSTYGSERPRV